MATGRHRERDDGTAGVADEVRVRHLAQRPVDQGVDDDPPLRRRRTGEGDAEARADRAAGAVTRHEVPRGDGRGTPAIGRPQQRLDVRSSLVEPVEFDLAPHVDRPLGERVQQRTLHRRLMDRHEWRVAERADGGRQHLDGLARRREDARARLDLRLGEHGLVDPDGLEDPQHLVVDHGGARQRVDICRAVDREGADAQIAEQQREQLADGPEPADKDVVVGHGVRPAGRRGSDGS